MRILFRLGGIRCLRLLLCLVFCCKREEWSEVGFVVDVDIDIDTDIDGVGELVALYPIALCFFLHERWWSLKFTGSVSYCSTLRIYLTKFHNHHKRLSLSRVRGSRTRARLWEGRVFAGVVG